MKSGYTHKFYFVTDILKRVSAIFWRGEKRSTQRNKTCNSINSCSVYTRIVARLIMLHGWKVTSLSLLIMKYAQHQIACNVHTLCYYKINVNLQQCFCKMRRFMKKKFVVVKFQLHVTYICLSTGRRDLSNGKLNSNNLSSLGSKTLGRRDLCFMRCRLYTKVVGHVVGLLTARLPSRPQFFRVKDWGSVFFFMAGVRKFGAINWRYAWQTGCVKLKSLK